MNQPEAPLAATISVTDQVAATVSPWLFGSFLEHLGRAVYGGIYEPDHPTANADGMRGDVMALVRELGVRLVRYPGGNFVSGYRWEDGVGPRSARPARLDLAWHCLETNQVGTNEFLAWAKALDVEPMLAFNLGSRGLAEAVDLLAYCNAPVGDMATLRASHGVSSPHAVKLWCLGNEADGDWQIGHLTASEYGLKAERVAHALRSLDDSLKLVACGSSGIGMATFGTWEETVLRAAYAQIDYLSCHMYVEEKAGDLASFLASGVQMDRFINRVSAICDGVGAELESAKQINISFDEWNVWYAEAHAQRDNIGGIDNWPIAPPFGEENYHQADAVVVGSMLISLLNHADRVKIACLAQLVNTIAPIMTVPGGPAWRQTTFYPFALTSPVATGQVKVCHLDVDLIETAQHGPVPALAAAAVAVDGGLMVFAVNRSTEAATTVAIELPEDLSGRAVQALGLADPDPYRGNTAASPNVVQPVVMPAKLSRGGRRIDLDLPPVSWVRLHLTN